MNLRFLTQGALVLALATGCSGVRQLDVKDTPTYTLADLQSQGDAAAARLTGKGGATIVHVRKGEELPVLMSIDVPGLTFVPGVNTLRFNRDLYLLISPDGAFLSPDGANWAKMGDNRAMHELFGLGKGGTFQLGIGASKERGAFVNAAVALPAAPTPG